MLIYFFLFNGSLYILVILYVSTILLNCCYFDSELSAFLDLQSIIDNGLM